MRSGVSEQIFAFDGPANTAVDQTVDLTNTEGPVVLGIIFLGGAPAATVSFSDAESGRALVPPGLVNPHGVNGASVLLVIGGDGSTLLRTGLAIDAAFSILSNTKPLRARIQSTAAGAGVTASVRAFAERRF